MIHKMRTKIIGGQINDYIITTLRGFTWSQKKVLQSLSLQVEKNK